MTSRQPAELLVVAIEQLWERDFLFELIAVERPRWRWIPVAGSPPGRLLRVLAQGLRRRPRVLVFSCNDLPFPEIWLYVRLLRPAVLVHLSDEWGSLPRHARLASRVPLLVRQYHHGHYAEPAQVRYMPLGYMRSMLGGRPSTGLPGLPAPADRPHRWGFVGNPDKQDRRAVLDRFAALGPGVERQGLSPPAMFELYRQCTFVPSPRGNVRMDCFRLYEASLAGAIPVLAGPPGEIDDTFRMEGDPPWIIADSWDAAIAICRAEWASPDRLLERQRRLLQWWERRVGTLRRDIAAHLG